LRTGEGSIIDVISNFGPQAILAKAIEFAEETILHGWRGTIDHVLSEVDDLANMMDPMIASILESQLAYEALRDAASAAADAQRDSAVAGGGSAAGTGGGSTPVQIKTPAQVAEEAAKIYAIEAAKTPSIAGYLTKPKVENLERATSSYLGSAALGYTTNRRAQIAIPQQTVRTTAQSMIQSSIAASLANRGLYSPIRRANGGYVPGFKSSGVPAILHGGEYVLNAKAVQNMGRAALDIMNNTRFSTPSGMSGQGAVTTINKTENINIYVDNFIGEEKWFEGMMDSYNIKVKPIKEKSRGEEVRVFNSYNYRTGR
jgi:phosphoribosyl-ATP pyrophosphohydrolase